MKKYCENCGKEIAENDLFCPYCGKRLSQNKMVSQINNTAPTNSNSRNSLAIAGFILSIVSSLLCCGMFNTISLILSIVGLTQAPRYNGNGKGLAIAGIVISASVMLLNFLFSSINVRIPASYEIPGTFSF